MAPSPYVLARVVPKQAANILGTLKLAELNYTRPFPKLICAEELPSNCKTPKPGFIMSLEMLNLLQVFSHESGIQTRILGAVDNLGAFDGPSS